MHSGTPAPSAVSEDDLKARLFGINGERSDLGYGADHDIEATAALQAVLDRSFLEPTDADIAGALPDIRRFLMSEDYRIVIPLGERGPVIRPVLETLTRQVPVHSILVVSDDADDAALDEVRRHKGVHLVFRNQVLDTLKWSKLLPVLNLTERPRSKGGKGVAVLAGYLYHYLDAQRSDGQAPRILFQTDSEIARFDQYLCLEHLAWGLRKHPNALCVKMAKPGRTNERSMIARSVLAALADSEHLNNRIRTRAQDLFLGLLRHKWMLSGEFGLAWDVAMQRPFATGYLEETLLAIFCADREAATNRPVVQVANRNPRLDNPNKERKEAIMQTQVGNFLLAMALEAVPTTEWTLDEIRRLNAGCMAKQLRMGWIPENHDPVRAEVIRQNRIWPSIEQLDRGGFIDEDKVEQLFAST